jgi:YHS domain-containing protein
MKNLKLSIVILLAVGLLAGFHGCKKTDNAPAKPPVKPTAPATQAPAQAEPQAATADQAKPVGQPQTVCPVMGGKIDKSLFADYQGKRVYFCCNGCPAQFKADPEKYIKAMEAKGIVLEKTPAK